MPSPARTERLRPRRGDRLLLEAVRHRAGQGAARLRQLRHRRAAAQARAHRGTRRAGHAEPPRRRGRVDRRRSVPRSSDSRPTGLATATEDEVTCCFALQDKVWVDGPDGEPWEIYTVLADVEMHRRAATVDRSTRCAAPTRAGVGCALLLKHRAMTDDLARRATAEVVGTALLVAIVVGSGIAAQRLSPDDVGLQLLENSIATGAGLVALILAFGPVSGAHFNPVVTLADRVLGGIVDARRGRLRRRAGRRRVRRRDGREPDVRPPRRRRLDPHPLVGRAVARRGRSPRSGCCS